VESGRVAKGGWDHSTCRRDGRRRDAREEREGRRGRAGLFRFSFLLSLNHPFHTLIAHLPWPPLLAASTSIYP
jgi:hypothetical protein